LDLKQVWHHVGGAVWWGKKEMGGKDWGSVEMGLYIKRVRNTDQIRFITA
jgi:hypothetical protein